MTTKKTTCPFLGLDRDSSVQMVAPDAAHRCFATNPIGVPEIVRQAGVSRRLLELRFRKALNGTIQEELQRTRLKRVRTLLAETNLSVTAIAKACGFTGKSYLGKVFRRTFGTTMTKYRAGR